MNGPLDEGGGVPLAVPAAWSNNATSRARSERITATTPTQSVVAPSRVGRRSLNAIRTGMSDRDWHVLRTVAEHRYLTTRHVEGFCFDGHATPLTAARVCRRVLRRLYQLDVLRHLERRVGGVRAGSASFVWQVGNTGQRLLANNTDAPRRRRHEPGWLFLDHCLAIADAHLSLIELARHGDIELIHVQTEPDCWRPYTELGGARLMLQPDLYVVTGAGEFEDHWFIEIDRGSEHPKRLLAKCRRYEDYRRSGIEQTDGGSFPLVVWAMRDEAQAERLKTAIAGDANLAQRLFRVTTDEDFAAHIQRGAV